MLYYLMLCYARLSYGLLCYVMSYHVSPTTHHPKILTVCDAIVSVRRPESDAVSRVARRGLGSRPQRKLREASGETDWGPKRF